MTTLITTAKETNGFEDHALKIRFNLHFKCMNYMYSHHIFRQGNNNKLSHTRFLTCL